jgi:hypothetical protein
MQRGRVDRFERTRPSLHDIFIRIANPSAEDVIEETAGVSKDETAGL